MRYESLKRLENSSVYAKLALSQWPKSNSNLKNKLAYTPLPSSHFLVGIDAYDGDKCWSGFIDLNEWLENVAPALASLASLDISLRFKELQELFNASSQPIQLPLSELNYKSLSIQILEKNISKNSACYLSIATPQCRLWIESFTINVRVKKKEKYLAYRTLNLIVDFCLGRSFINRKILSTMSRGDVLLIDVDTFELYSSEQRIGKFMINDNGELLVQKSNGVVEIEENEGHISLGEIPMRVDFILQRRTMTLMELDDLYQGQYLQLDPCAEKKVEIIANGIRIARGELVEFNGRLGIELNHVRVSSKGIEKSD